MSERNLNAVRRNSPKRTEPARRRASQVHTVSRYRLRLIREEEESVSEPETLSRPAEIAAFLRKRIFDGLDREAMCAVYVDSLVIAEGPTGSRWASLSSEVNG